jgi:hypothetical protein
MGILKTLLILFFGFFVVQSTYGQLNKQIYNSQKKAIYISPFKDALRMQKEISRQKKIRHEYLKVLENLKKEFPQDTILLTENYDFICSGCTAGYVQIQLADTLISLMKDFESKVYEWRNERLEKFYSDKGGYYHSDIHELRMEISKGDSWLENPKKYGTENCLDGGHTFYTVIYPVNKIQSMYMRCWINKEWRNKNP